MGIRKWQRDKRNAYLDYLTRRYRLTDSFYICLEAVHVSILELAFRDDPDFVTLQKSYEAVKPKPKGLK